MRKFIDLDQSTLSKLKTFAVYEHLSVKALIENAVQSYVKNKETQIFNDLTTDEKENFGLLLLMHEAVRNDIATREEITMT